MRHISFILLIMICFQIQALNLKLKNKVNVRNSHIYLSDLVDKGNLNEKQIQSLEEILIAEIPEKQSFINISNKQISDILRQTGSDELIVKGPLVSVYLESNLITQDEIKTQIETYVRSQIKLSENAEFEYLKIPILKKPESDYAIKCSSPELNQGNGRAIVLCKVIAQGNTVYDFTVNLKIFDIYDVYQIKSSMKQSEKFLPDNLIKTYSKEVLNLKYQMSYQEILECVSSTYLPKGMISEPSLWFSGMTLWMS